MTAAEPGLRQRRTARSTGRPVSVIDGEAAGMDTAGGRWQTVCDDHGFICSHQTWHLARDFASAPEQWCEVCAGTEPDRGTPEWEAAYGA